MFLSRFSTLSCFRLFKHWPFLKSQKPLKDLKIFQRYLKLKSYFLVTKACTQVYYLVTISNIYVLNLQHWLPNTVRTFYLNIVNRSRRTIPILGRPYYSPFSTLVRRGLCIKKIEAADSNGACGTVIMLQFHEKKIIVLTTTSNIESETKTKAQ